MTIGKIKQIIASYALRDLFLILLAIALLPYCNCVAQQEAEAETGLRKYDDLKVLSTRLPYVLDVSNSLKRMIYYGVRHSNMPTDSMFIDIEKQFLTLSPQIVFNEGGDGWPAFKNRDSVIALTCDAGFTRFLCRVNNIPVKNIETPDSLEFKHLLSSYKKNDVLLMYFVRQIEQAKRERIPATTMEKYLQRHITYLRKKGFRLSEQEANLSNVISYYELFYKRKFDVNTFDPSTYWPIYNKTLLNEISRESSYFRDRYAVRLIAEALRIYDLKYLCQRYKEQNCSPPVCYYFLTKNDIWRFIKNFSSLVQNKKIKQS